MCDAEQCLVVLSDDTWNPGSISMYNGSDVVSMTDSVIFCQSASHLSERTSLLIWVSCLNVRPTCGSEGVTALRATGYLKGNDQALL